MLVLLMLLSKLQGGCKSPFLAQKNKKSDFYAFHCIAWHRIVLHGIALYLMVSHSFHVDRMVLHGIVLYLTVLHGIALLASAHGLYLARHLSILSLLLMTYTVCVCVGRMRSY